MVKKPTLADSPKFPLHKGVHKGSHKGLPGLLLCLERLPESHTWGCRCPSAVTDLQKGPCVFSFVKSCSESHFGKLLEKQRGFLFKAFTFQRVCIRKKKKKERKSFSVCLSGKEYLLIKNSIRPISSWSSVGGSGPQETTKLE